MLFLSLALFAGLFVLGRYNYLLFHSIAEAFSIVIACAIFMIAWNARSMLENHYLLFVGIAYLFVGVLDFTHTLAYKGMGVFRDNTANPATQMWIAARFFESISLLIAGFFIRRRLKTGLAMAGCSIVTALFLLTVFRWDIFPACFVEPEGLTVFKKVSEYVIAVIFLAAGGLLFSARKSFDRDVFRLLLASIFISTAAELTFTLYSDVYGLINLSGHFLKIVSFYLIYRAIIVTGLVKPQTILFRSLQENEAFLNSVVMSSLSGLYLYDLVKKTNLFINPEYTKFTGYSLADIQAMDGAGFFDLFHPDDRAEVALHWERLMKAADGESHEIEYRFKTAQGRWIWFLSRDAVFKRADDGSGVQVIGSFLDITERKKAEAELKRRHDELEERVKRRTAVLRWRNRELREFAYVASHDLQEPLRKIQTFGKMLEREAAGNLDAKSMDYLQRMSRAASHMQALVQNLLAYSRLTSDVQPFVATDLRQVARNALSNLEVKISETGASITVGDLPTVEADPIQMTQLFQNLITNALRYHRKGRRPEVSIYAPAPRTEGVATGFCEIHFQDDGIGFDERFLEQIFKPFKKLHAWHEYEGTGMGLSICRKIVERHDGSITAKSAPGNGATFIVRLPLAQKGRGYAP